ncbi:MAG: M13 family metallopeptidase [Candidatus Marinimicrobia bacterium]|nr:M13 family metallopeptidase [Candidatus Neomarinimicrobiota bacterium]
MKYIVPCLLCLFLVKSCSQSEFTQLKAIDPANMDASVSPGDDFYQFANGTWLKKNPVPDDYSRYGAFEELREKNLKDLRTVMENAAKNENAVKGSNIQKIGDFYASGMNTEKIEQDGLIPIKPFLDRIEAIKSLNDVQNTIAFFHKMNITPLFSFFAEQDFKNSEMNIGWFYQSGLGLPDRDYYTDTGPQSDEIRREYKAHLQRMFQLTGDSEELAKANAETVMKIETRLAKSSMTRVEQRNPKAIYNPVSLQEFQRMSVQYDWVGYLNQMGVDPTGTLNIAQPKFFKEISAMVRQVPVNDWKTYLRWHLVNETAAYLSSDFENANFDFYEKFLSGTQKLQPRWKRVLNTNSQSLGEAVGQIYVEKYFPPEAKERALDLVYNLKHAYAERIKYLDWMSDATKAKALEKLDAFRIKIGYPEKWLDYSALEINRDSYVINILNANVFEVHRTLKKINKPVDINEWYMSPQTVNAYYNPGVNEIVFPAAILQAPFFNFKADDPVNYGAIGAVIGHEMTHGFDDQGRQYDKNGNLNDWWTKVDEEKFNERTKLVIGQADNYTVIDTFKINGKLTLGENIADLGGLTIAFAALQIAMQKNPAKPEIDGVTPEQRFYLSWAQVWRSNIRRENQLLRLKTDVHSPAKYRTNGPVSNLPEFHTAFNVTEDQTLYRNPDEIARIW